MSSLPNYIGHNAAYSDTSRMDGKSAGVSRAKAILLGTVMLGLGAVTGWSFRPGPAGGTGFSVQSALGFGGGQQQQQVVATDTIARDRRIRLAKLDVDNYEAQVQQSQEALDAAKSLHQSAKQEYEACVASATARNELAQKILAELTEASTHHACTRAELSTAAMNAKVSEADLHAARSKLLVVATFQAAIAQRAADVRANTAKLHVAEAELEYAQQ